jgi:signal transduction histidine kinase
LVDAACEDLRKRRPEIEVHNMGAFGPALVDASTTELRRCIENLITNAQRYAVRRIAVRLEYSFATASVTVEDDGPGLPTLRAYAQAWSSHHGFRRDDRMTGSGRGLSIVRQIVDRYGGRVTAGRSALGGAAFGFSLPVVAPS